ncbi:MAG: hypothetical protein HUU55_23160 [Myxococcales bacterium]|nr:hypothetical protein [Myxococcales bacterium]
MVKISYLLLCLSCCSPAVTAAQTDQVAWVDRGQKHELSPSDACYGQMIDAALTLAAGATEKWKRIIGPAERLAITQEQVSIHIRFKTPRRVRNVALQRDLDLNEVMIPLSGPLANGRTVILFADPDFGETNQLVFLGGCAARDSLEKCLPKSSGNK